MRVLGRVRIRVSVMAKVGVTGWMGVCMCACTYLYVCVCMLVSVFMCVCVYTRASKLERYGRRG